MATVRVDDIDLYYEQHGTGAPLLVIPGLGGDIGSCERLITDLASTYAVLAFDPRGAGRSGKPDGPYSIEMMADDAARLMQAVGLETANVLGFSMGGRIALALALRHPERVTSLILAATSARTVEDLRARARRIVLASASRLPGVRRPDAAYARQEAAWRTSDWSGRLEEIRAPTLIVHGREDRVVPFARAVELHDGVAGSELALVAGDHLFLVNGGAPQLAALVRDFVRA